MKRLLQLLTFYRYDLIWIEKEIFPYLPAWVERFLKFVGKPYVVDYDDATFHTYDRSTNPLIRRLLGRKIDAVMRHSSCVVAGNQYLANRAVEAGATKVRIVPTVVDSSRYSVKPDAVSEPRVIGWIGSPSSAKYLLPIRAALIGACKSHNARLLLIGATPEIATEFPDVEVQVVPWTEETEARLIRLMDIGIMPLRDGPWELGKCGYKLIQYMACGVPVIASPVGSNSEIVSSSKAGVLASTIQEWEQALQQLLRSAETRTIFGRRGREAVERNYSLRSQVVAVEQVLEEAIT
ncbi:MAG TPA: glycosyltransferase family 4 protein [Gemmatimonadaceae bacterium]|jgi:glycosyltransferase involved in cell wall biosynthesis